MNTHLKYLLSASEIFKQTRDCIEEALSASGSRNNERFTLFLTVGEFKELKEFYGSRKMLYQLTSAYVGRLVRAYSLQSMINSAEVNSNLDEIMHYADEHERIAVERLNQYYTKKYGVVKQERINELDIIADGMNAQAQVELKEMFGQKESIH